jgi:hypothetical protein
LAVFVGTAFLIGDLADDQADFLQDLFCLVTAETFEVRYEDFFTLVALADGQVDRALGFDDRTAGRRLAYDFPYGDL